MDTTRQLLRWTIPGTVFVLVALGGRALACQPIECDPLLATSGHVAFVVGSVLPIGFVLYQLYFAGYHRGRRRATPLDRGAEVLRHVQHVDAEIIERLSVRSGWDPALMTPTTSSWTPQVLGGRLQRLVGLLDLRRRFDVTDTDENGDAGPVGSDRTSAGYARRHAENMSALLLLMDTVPDHAVPSRERLREEYISLSDIYHAQGAARSACWYGGIAAILASNPVMESGGYWPWTFVATATILLGAVLAFVMHHARRHTLLRLVATLRLGLTHAFVPESDPT